MNDKSNIRRIRVMQDLTQTELAEKVGCSQAYIAMLENGIKRGSIQVMQTISAALHCTVDELLQEETEVKQNAKRLKMASTD